VGLRAGSGLRRDLPISDVNENFTLEYVSRSLGEPKYSVEECIERDMTYAAPLKATLRLIVWEDLEDGERRPRTSSRRRSTSVTFPS
jgi:DNA-directed RNA polymerase beta subunit